MQYTIDSVENLNLNFTISILDKKLKSKAQHYLQEFSKDKKFKLQGFRPGKIPLNVIQKYKGQEAQDKALNDLINVVIDDLIKQEKYIIANISNIDYVELDSVKGVHILKAHAEIFPKFDKHDLSALKIIKPTVDIEKSLDSLLVTLQKQQSPFVKVDKAAENGDKVIVDFEGFKDGVAFDNGKAENIEVILGEGKMIPDFEKAILGHKAGEEFEANVKFPEEYQAKELAGADTVFKFKLHTVEKLELVEINEEFIKKILPKIQNPTLENLRTEMRNNVEREIKLNVNKYAFPQIATQLIEQYKGVELPEGAVKKEAKRIKEEKIRELATNYKLSEDVARSILDKANGDDFSEEELLEARAKLLSDNVFSTIISENNITASLEETKDFINDLSIMFENPKEYIAEALKNKEMLFKITAELIQIKLVNFILEKANVENKDFTYEDLTVSIYGKQ